MAADPDTAAETPRGAHLEMVGAVLAGDGLERVAGDLGFLGKGASASYQLIPDYTLPFLGNTALSTIFAGAIGVIVVGAIIVLLGQGMKAKS